MVADIGILLILVVAALAGMRLGFMKQLTVGIGLLLALFALAFLYGKLAFLSQSSGIRTAILGILVLGVGFLCYDLCLGVGEWLRKRVWAKAHAPKAVEQAGGGAAAVVTATILIWLCAAVFAGSIPAAAQHAVDASRLLDSLNQIATVPPVFKNTAHLLAPFRAPDVFADHEPTFDTNDTRVVQQFTSLDSAMQRAKSSTVKVNAWGCGSTSLGSGFLVGKRWVATNAHVIAGAGRMSVQDDSGTHVARPVLFDPHLDVAILQTETDLSGVALVIQSKPAAPGTIAAALGYPNGQLHTEDATIMQFLSATGFDIYNKSKTLRRVYAIRANIQPGNSGGPLINKDGEVIGIVFGHSTAQLKAGYVIAADQLSSDLAAALKQNSPVGTGSCTGS